VTPADAAFVVRRVSELWPGCDWTPQIQEIFSEKVVRHDRDSAIKAIEEYRLTKPGRTPDPAALCHHINERLRKPADYGYKLAGYWNVIAARMDMESATLEQVIVAYWKSFAGVWSTESLWFGVVDDARRWLAQPLDNAAWIADNAVGPMPECLSHLKEIDADMERLTADGRKKATEEMRRRLEKKDKDVTGAFVEIKAQAVRPKVTMPQPSKPTSMDEEIDF
jgi:hypothetical protein